MKIETKAQVPVISLSFHWPPQAPTSSVAAKKYQFFTRSESGQLPKRMVVRDSLLRAYVAENSQLLLVLSTHVFFLPAVVVETRECSGTGSVFL
jgi:hypothetical protein